MGLSQYDKLMIFMAVISGLAHQLVEKPGSTALRMICHFSKEDHLGQSMNSWLDSDDFLVFWFTASQTADFVSLSFIIFPFGRSPHWIYHVDACA